MSIYKVTALFPDGKVHEASSDDWDFYSLTRALDKCEIISFTVSLAVRVETFSPHTFQFHLIHDIMSKDDYEFQAFDPDEVRKYLTRERWVVDIAREDHRQWADIETVVRQFILKYWMFSSVEEVTTLHVAEIMRIARDFQS